MTNRFVNRDPGCSCCLSMCSLIANRVELVIRKTMTMALEGVRGERGGVRPAAGGGGELY